MITVRTNPPLNPCKAKYSEVRADRFGCIGDELNLAPIEQCVILFPAVLKYLKFKIPATFGLARSLSCVTMMTFKSINK